MVTPQRGLRPSVVLRLHVSVLETTEAVIELHALVLAPALTRSVLTTNFMRTGGADVTVTRSIVLPHVVTSTTMGINDTAVLTKSSELESTERKRLVFRLEKVGV